MKLLTHKMLLIAVFLTSLFGISFEHINAKGDKPVKGTVAKKVGQATEEESEERPEERSKEEVVKTKPVIVRKKEPVRVRTEKAKYTLPMIHGLTNLAENKNPTPEYVLNKIQHYNSKKSSDFRFGSREDALPAIEDLLKCISNRKGFFNTKGSFNTKYGYGKYLYLPDKSKQFTIYYAPFKEPDDDVAKALQLFCELAYNLAMDIELSWDEINKLDNNDFFKKYCFAVLILLDALRGRLMSATNMDDDSPGVQVDKLFFNYAVDPSDEPDPANALPGVKIMDIEKRAAGSPDKKYREYVEKYVLKVK